MKTRLLSLFLVMLAAIMPMKLWAADGTAEPYAVLSDNDTKLTFYYDDQKEARGGMSVGPFTLDSDVPWYNQRESITTAEFDTSFANCTTLTSTAYWFSRCKNMVSISGLEYLKTDNVTDMGCMFMECSGLTSLNVSSFNTANVTEMNGMFAGCSSLMSLDLSGFNTQNVTNMGGMFYNCSSLTNLDISGFNTAKVTSMNGMFYNCSGLTTLDVKHFDTSSAISMYNMFGHCTSLESLDLSHFNTSGVVDMHNMFRYCSALTDLNVSSFNTSNVTDMNSMFGRCESLITIDLSSFNTAKVKDMQNMFRQSQQLKTIYAGDRWSTTSIEQGDSLFYQCTSLVGGAGTTYDENHIDHTYAHIDGGTSNPGYFTENNERVINGDLEGTDYSSFAWGYNYDIKDLTSNEIVVDSDDPNNHCIKIVSMDDSDPNTLGETEFVIKLGKPLQQGQKYSFSMRAKASKEARIQSVALKESYEYHHWKMVGDHNMTTQWATYTFESEVIQDQAGCNAIGFLLDIEPSSTEYYFDDISFRVEEAPVASSEPYAVLSENDTKLTFFYDDKKEARGGMSVGPFSSYAERGWNDHCGNITNVVFDESFADCTTLTNTAHWFYRCENLASITDIKNLKTDNVTRMRHMFRYCSALTNLDVSGFKTDNVTDMRGLFSYCSSLTSLDVSHFNTENVTDMMAMFDHCSKLTTIDVSRFNTEKVTNMSVMLQLCTSLTSIDLSNFITPNLTNTQGMFYGCSNLLNLDIRNFDMSKVNNEEKNMFVECHSLASIIAGNANILAEEYANIANPNLLVYVNEPSLAPSNVQNVVINGLAKNIKLVTTDGNHNFYVPEPFVAESISYGRLFEQSTQIGVSRGWETIALPFDVQTVEHETKGVIAPFNNSASNRHFWLRRLGDNGLQAVTSIEANTPYVISMPNSSEYPDEYNLAGYVTFKAQNVTVPVTQTKITAMADSSIVMVPTMQSQSRSSAVWALNVGEVRGSYFEGSVFERDYREVRPFEAYTVHRQENSYPAPRYVPLMEIGGTTGIDTMENVRGKMDDVWYTLDGLKLQGKPKQKGVYIQNGQKVVVK